VWSAGQKSRCTRPVLTGNRPTLATQQSQTQLRHIPHREKHLSAVGQQDKSEFFVKGRRIFI